jgi:hypothetical protein
MPCSNFDNSLLPTGRLLEELRRLPLPGADHEEYGVFIVSFPGRRSRYISNRELYIGCTADTALGVRRRGDRIAPRARSAFDPLQTWGLFEIDS